MINIISKFFHWETFKLIWKNCSNALTDNELLKVRDSDRSQRLGSQLERELRREWKHHKISGRIPNIKFILLKIFLWPYLFSGILLLLSSVIRLCQPFFIIQIIRLHSFRTTPYSGEIDMWAGLLVVAFFCRFALHKHYMHLSKTIGLRVRIACAHLIFRKVLHMKASAWEQEQVHPMAALSTDVSHLEMAAAQLHWLWVGPLLLVATSAVLYVTCDLLTLACVVAVYATFLLLLMILCKISSSLWKRAAKFTDKRIRLLSEVISGINTIKICAWEKAFQKIIDKARGKEVQKLLLANIVKGIFDCSHLIVDRIQIILVLIASTMFSEKLVTYQIFGVMLLLIVSRTILTGNLPVAFCLLCEFNETINRIKLFLEADIPEGDCTVLSSKLDPGGVELKKVSASWSSESEVLRSITFSLRPGQLCALIGPVGSGKTSLLHVLLSELRHSSGVVELGGSVSYSAQEPWTFHGTVRENILFGEELDQTRYDEVIRVCGLKTDLEQLSHGDGTLVGERGVKLSGGQRSRISLARAIYRKADIFLLDDPLSSVDSRMSKYLFKECILKFLKNKTRIIATHHIHSLPLADLVIVMNKGSIQYQGSFRELRQSGISLRSYVNVELNDMGYSGSNERKNRKRYFAEIHEETKTSKSFIRGYKMEDVWRYLRTGGGAFGFMIYITFIAGSVVSFYTYNIIVGLWDRYVHRDRLSSMLPALYALIATVLLAALRSVVASVATLRTSSLLHASMARAVLGAKMEVFHDTPAGSLLAYFTEDVDVLDKQLPKTAEWLMMGLAFCVADICMVGYINQYTLISMLPLTVLAIATVRLCSMTLRNCKLLENTKRAKYFALVNDAASGLTVVRVFKKTNHILNNFQSNEDDYTSSKMLTAEVGTTQWFIVSLISACIISLNIFILLKTGRVSDTTLLCFAFLFTMFNEESVGIVTEQIGKTAIELPSIRNCFTIADMEQEEDVVQYGDKVEIMKADWPNGGEIEFRNVSLRYSEDGPKVLRNVSFVINAGEKIGLVGRTGAGKSSLLQALLRLATVEDDGAILVNFMDTRHVPLQVLRRSITFIPQDPVMFSGSVRDNLDPLHENLDAMLWDALRRVELVEHVNSLDSLVEEKGSNWSVGEKQLLCLARAFLRNSRILLLDEATASVDQETNTLIQRSLKQLFEPCTIVTIAHRISTIMDNDRILVMDSGRLVEFGKPSRLLNNVHSHFYKMVRDAGREMSEQMSLISREETRF